MRRLALICSLLLAFGVLAPVGPAAAGKPRADLVVSAGSVAQTGSSLSVSTTVKNKGRKKAKASTGAFTVGGVPLAAAPVPKVKPRKKRTLTFAATLPSGLPAGTHVVRVCADSTRAVKERSDKNNCRDLGSVTVAAASSVPTAPIPFTTGAPFFVGAGAGYWAYVPSSYDASHQTPTKLLVWMHGCGGEAEGDTYLVSPGGAQDWLSISLGGRDGGCWDANADPALVLAALADVKTHFNVDPRRVVIGGYSSGGDLAYRTAFYNAKLFAGLIAENTSPFRDTGSSATQSIAAASWKFNVVHLLHTEDDVYPAAGVRSEIAAMTAAGFPVTTVERPGEHYDAATDADLRTYLLPALGAGWLSPPA